MMSKIGGNRTMTSPAGSTAETLSVPLDELSVTDGKLVIVGSAKEEIERIRKVKKNQPRPR